MSFGDIVLSFAAGAWQILLSGITLLFSFSAAGNLLAVLILASVLGAIVWAKYNASRRRARRRLAAAESDRLRTILSAVTEGPAGASESASHAALDPAAFLAALHEAEARGGPVEAAVTARTWLDPLVPALERAYAVLAAEALTSADSGDALRNARRLAAGAEAARPGSAAAARLCTIAEEAEERRIFDTLSEAGRLAWRIGRLSPDRQSARSAGASIVSQGLYRVGGALRLSGWEPEEMRAEALDLIGFGPMAGIDEPAGEAAEPARPVRPALPTLRPRRIEALPRLVAATATPDSAGRPAAAPQRRFRVVDREPRRNDGGIRSLRMRANVAYDIGRAGRHAEAEEAFHQIWEEMRRIDGVGEAHPDMLAVRHNRAQMLLRMGRCLAAEDEFRAIAVMMRRQRNAFPEALSRGVRHGIAACAEALGRNREAEAIYRELWEDIAGAGGAAAESPAALWARMRMLIAREAHASRA